MSRDGLLPAIFSDVHPSGGRPERVHLIFMVFREPLLGLLPISSLGNMTSIGTLLAFVIVSIAVMVMRRTHPDCRGLPDAAGAAGADPASGVLSAMMVSLDVRRGTGWYLAGDRTGDLLRL